MLDNNPPQFEKDTFRCPHCNVFAKQEWSKLNAPHIGINTGGSERLQPLLRQPEYHFHEVKGLKVSVCHNCENIAVWIDEGIIFPIRGGPIPNSDMPDSVKEIYNEARNVKNISGKSAAALLRLALEKLLKERDIGDENDSLGTRIDELVAEEDISQQTEKMLDIVRNVGNDAVHPGKIYLGDTEKAAEKLFYLINRITEELITVPRETEEMFDDIPENKKKGIRQRKKRIKKKD